MTLENIVIQDRKHAGYLLSQKLSEYKDSNAIVTAIPRVGLQVGYYLAEALKLPLEISLCRKINHPGDSSRAIGSVSHDNVALHGNTHGIPQDYIYHQVTSLRHAIAHEHKFYYGDAAQPSFRHKTVILVDDHLTESDTMLTCLRSIRKQQPLRIIVAVPTVTAATARAIAAEADNTVFLRLEHTVDSVKRILHDPPSINIDDLRELFLKSKRSPRGTEKTAPIAPNTTAYGNLMATIRYSA